MKNLLLGVVCTLFSVVSSAQTFQQAPIFGGQSVQQLYHQAIQNQIQQGQFEGFHCGNDYNNSALIPASSPCFEVTKGYGSICWNPSSGGANNIDPACSIAPLSFPTTNGGKYQVPIRITIFEDSNWIGANYLNGTGFQQLSDPAIDQKLAAINALYGNAQIQFYECRARNRVQNADMFDFYQNNDPNTGENDGTGDLNQTAMFDQQNVINIYFVGGIEGDHDCCGTMGFAPYPPSRDFIIMRYGTAVGGTTFEHELGHYFGLHHTHKAGPSLSTGDVYGFPDGNLYNCDCKTSGDGICDTWPDPNFSYQCGSNCWGLDAYCFISDVYPRCEFDSAGFACVSGANNAPATALPLNPNHGVNSGNGMSTILNENVMTYNLYNGCRQAFSPCQYKKINDVLLNCRSYLCYSGPERYFSSQAPGDPHSPHQEICVGDPAPTFIATFPGSNSASFNWYAEENSSQALVLGSTTFTPALGSGPGQLNNMLPGTYYFYLQGVNSYNDCKMRVEVVVNPSAGPASSTAGMDSLSLCGQSTLLLQAHAAQLYPNEIVGWWISNSPLSFTDQNDLDIQLANVSLGGSINQASLNHLFPAAVNKKELSLSIDCSQLTANHQYYATPLVSKDNVAPPSGFTAGPQSLNDYNNGNPGVTEIIIPAFQLPSNALLEQVCIDLVHPVTNDLVIDLIAPDGTVIPMVTFLPFTYPRGDFDACLVDDGTGASTFLGCNGNTSEACFVGSIESVTPFSAYQGNPNGDWTLRITDQNNAGFGGSLTHAELIFDQSPVALIFPDVELSDCTIGEPVKFSCNCGNNNGGNVSNLIATHPQDSALGYSQLKLAWTPPPIQPDGYLIQFSDDNGQSWHSPQTHPWINEIHYDNAGADVNEGVEIAGAAGMNLSCYGLYLYDGANGSVYGSPLSLTGIFSDEGTGYGALWFGINAMQNQADGLALVYEGNGDCNCPGSQQVIELLSYEAAFSCQNGPAAGMTTALIHTSESSATQSGHSLQRSGCGSECSDFNWTTPLPHSRGSLNNNQSAYTLAGNQQSYFLSQLTPCTHYTIRISPISCTTGAGTFVSSLNSMATYGPDLTYVLNAPTSVCEGTGTSVQLSQSQAGFSYQLLNGNGQEVGPAQLSVGAALTFTIPTSELLPTASPHAFQMEVSSCTCSQLLQSSVQIAVSALPDAGSNSSLSICDNANPSTLFAQLGGTPEAGGSWSGPSSLGGGDQGIYDPASAQAGTYTYTIADPGCPVSSASVVVSEIAGPNAGVDGALGICENAAASSLFSQLGGSPQAGGIWSGPSSLGLSHLGNYDPATCDGGVYTYVVTAVGCPPDVSHVNVTESSIPYTGLNTTLYICGSASPVYLFLQLGGAPDAMGTWTGPAALGNGFMGAYNPAIHPAGTYTYTITNPGCSPVSSTVDIIYFNASSAGVSSSLSLCAQGDPVNLFQALGGSPHTGGSWTGPNSLSNGYWGTFDPQNMQAGSYTYSLTAGGCPPSTAQVHISLTPNPQPLAEQNCSNCQEIQLSYCDNCPNPPDPAAYIDGSLSANGNYLSGYGLQWYMDNGGSPGTALNGSPAVDLSQQQTYWLSQVDPLAGCESQARKLHILPQNAPDLLINHPASQLAGSSLDLATTVNDLAGVTSAYRFYEADPALGSVAIGSLLASNGTPLSSQHAWVNPPAGLHTYWVVADNDPLSSLVCHDTSIILLHFTPSGNVQVDIRIALEGAMDHSNGLMRDKLRTKGYLTVEEPYSNLGLPHASSSVEQMNPLLLDQSGNNAIVDWVILELRAGNDSTQVVATRAALLQRDGDVVDTDGQSPVAFGGITAGNYFLSIKHRNHLGVMSAHALPWGSSPQWIDISDPNFPLLGVLASKVVNGKQLLISGDASGDGQTQNNDIVDFWRNEVGTSGYMRADLDMDGEVQNSDMIQYWRPNVGRGTQIPE